MSQPTPEELLILNSIIYTDTDYGPRAGSIYDWAHALLNDPTRLAAALDPPPAAMTAEEYRRILATIDGNPGVYGQMKVKDVTTTPASLNSPGKEGQESVSATIDYNGQPIIVFKGTAGDKDWRDNGVGGYADVTDTPEQQAALRYFNEQMANYPGVQAIVTGHSKGGNKAQYVTVVAGDRVDHTYSFDDQGFNRAFMLKYADQIEDYASKITSISNQNDFVNILFTVLPGIERYYTDSPLLNTGNPIESAMRWHSPVTMFDHDGDGVTLDLSDATGFPGAMMAELDGFTEFAQGFMTQEDFKYFCYLVMSGMMDGNGERYGEVVGMPEGFKQRCLGLVKNYLDVEGIDPQDLLIKAPALGAVVGRLVGNPALGLFGGAVTGAELALVLATIPSPGYTTTPRDFSDTVRNSLLTVVGEVESEPAWDITRWDVWYRIDHTVFGGVDFPADESDRITYYRKMIDMNGTSAQDIARIWSDVTLADRVFADTVRSWTDKAQACVDSIRRLAERIPR